ncbi:hypothetical protein AvCA_01750 [Azotobacter vinelandii CA]|uniref:DUF3301 domain-containing protein n=2 Tax=Azotobacter vinelandii TaxID=354 RepID=C1DH30_AZOVD|nr:DUF3301 domain-containing protein [Azotobacter vinelandii]ACO76437.1 conserved hypothetical protein [Azotobacter vinelandii DJ]AGK17408.1 hypothetical protein AvCA_01750 [Azotobacter vinelandii CA]AGK19121.1 hypothetical protein AvCA6_01750 [Azotobacter vinelandii CA6]WKN22216.1 DUF3301 domain-containing protein [Azotobacter vinelandii]SFX77462.1 Protein of unknown function [Azotobacter vinelandii]
MLTLANLSILLLLAGTGAWLWHTHGLRERALAAVRQHCAKAGVDLLDDNVALRRFGLHPDARGHRRMARIYDFEFTVTGEQRYNGSIVMFGRHVARIELGAHPFPAPLPPSRQSAEVIQLDQWRREHPSHKQHHY